MNKMLGIAATMSFSTGLFVSPVLFGVGVYMVAKSLIVLRSFKVDKRPKPAKLCS